METDDKQQHLLFPNNKSRGSKKNEKEDEDSEISYDAEDLGILLLNKGVVSKSGEVKDKRGRWSHLHTYILLEFHLC